MQLFPSVLAVIFCVATAHASNIFSQEVLGLISSDPTWSGEGWSYTSCGSETDLVQVTFVSVSPEPPKPGKNVTLVMKADVLGTIEEGAFADIQVRVEKMTTLWKTYDLCEIARSNEAEVQCPVEKGKYDLEEIVMFPKEIPHARMSVDVRGYTVEDEEMLCGTLIADFRT